MVNPANLLRLVVEYPHDDLLKVLYTIPGGFLLAGFLKHHPVASEKNRLSVLAYDKFIGHFPNPLAKMC